MHSPGCFIQYDMENQQCVLHGYFKQHDTEYQQCVLEGILNDIMRNTSSA